MTDAEKALEWVERAVKLTGMGHFGEAEYVSAALKAQEKPVEVNNAILCVTILDTQPDKEFGTWQVIDVLEAIKSLGLKIIEGGECRHTGASCLYVGC